MSTNDTLAAHGPAATRSRAPASHVLAAVALTVLTPPVVLAALSTPGIAVAAALGALATGVVLHGRR
jgi:hypothetical protein